MEKGAMPTGTVGILCHVADRKAKNFGKRLNWHEFP